MSARIGRREFVTLIGAAAAWPLAAHAPALAQPADKIKRLGVLMAAGSEAASNADNATLLRELAQFGWTEGRNLRVDYRFTGSNDPDVLRPHAEALVRAGPDVIFAAPGPAVQVLQKLTRTIPIVFTSSGDPVQGGMVQSLTHPGGNITGFLVSEPSINTKYLQLLKDMAPTVKRVAVLQTRASSWRDDFALVKSVAANFAVSPVSIVVRDDPADLERAVSNFAHDPDGGLILPPDNVMFGRHRDLIVALAAKYRLPTIYWNRRIVEAGGLMSYNAAPVDFRLVAGYLDRILRGAKPGDLPVQTPTKFELVINLKTATALGLTIPPSLFALADEVIE